MSKKQNERRDFDQDLANLANDVEAGVGDVLQVLRQKRASSNLAIVEEKTAPQARKVQKAETETNPDADNDGEIEATPRMRRARTGGRSRIANQRADDVILMNVTTRLRPETNELLTEAALHQQLKKTTPDSRQDIVEEALQDWFRKHGYLR